MNISLKLCFAWESHFQHFFANCYRRIGRSYGWVYVSKKDPGAPSALCLARSSDIIILRYFPANTLLLELFDSTSSVKA